MSICLRAWSSRKSGAITLRAAADLQPPVSPSNWPGVGLHSRQVGLGIRRCFHGVPVIQHVGNFQERAGVLRHHVRCIAIRPGLVECRDVAIRKREAAERELMGGAHHIDVDARRLTERRQIDRLQAFEPRLRPLRDGPLPLGRAIGRAWP